MDNTRSIETVKPVYIAAFEPELTPLRERFGANKGFYAFTVGIGAIAASAGTAGLIQGLKHQLNQNFVLVFVGSYGSVDQTVEVPSLVCIRSVSMVDLALLQGLSDAALNGPTRVFADEARCSHIVSRPTTDVLVGDAYSTLSITRDPETARNFSRATSSNFENLELFGIAVAAKEAGIPWVALGPVTNHVSPNGRIQWQRTHVLGAQMVAQTVGTIFDVH